MMRFLLVPGAGGAASYWYRVVPLLRDAGHEAVAVDLPADDPAFGLPEYVELEVAAASGFGTDAPLVAVAQSLGGFSAPTAAGRLGATSIVLLNAMIPKADETPGEWWGATGQGEAMAENDRRQGRTTRTAPGEGFDIETYFLHDVPDDVRAATADGGRPQSGTVFGTPFPGWPEIPVRVLAGADDRLLPVAFQQHLAADRLGVEATVVPGGHLAALSRPVELVAALLAISDDV